MARGFYQVVGHFGFMEEPDVPALLALCHERGLKYHPADTTYFLSRETILAESADGMCGWQTRLFGFMSRNAHRVTLFFNLPPNRVVELGMQIKI